MMENSHVHGKAFFHCKKQWTIVLWLLVIAAGFFAVDCMSLHTGDDLGYLFSDSAHHLGDGTRIHTFRDIITTQCSHYTTTNGRFLVHVAVMATLNLVPLWVFRLINALVFTFLVFILDKIVNTSKNNEEGNKQSIKPSFATLFFTAFVVLVAVPQPAVVLFTLVAYSVNYLWVAAVVMAWIWTVERGITGWGTCVAAVVAGSLQESFSLPLCAGILTAVLLHQLPWRVFLCLCAGTAVCVFAPGNFAHAAQGGGMGVDALVAKITALGKDLPFMFITWATAAYLVWMVFRRKAAVTFGRENLPWIVTCAAAVLLAFVTYTSPRQLTFPNLLAAMMVLRGLENEMFFTKKVLSNWKMEHYIGIIGVVAYLGILVLIGWWRFPVYQRWQEVLKDVRRGKTVVSPLHGIDPKTVKNTYMRRGWMPDPLADCGLIAVGDRYTTSALTRLRKTDNPSAPAILAILPAPADSIVATYQTSSFFGPYSITITPVGKKLPPLPSPRVSFTRDSIIYTLSLGQ